MAFFFLVLGWSDTIVMANLAVVGSFAAGSVLWFSALGLAAFWLGRRLDSRHVWRALDGLVALMMWGTAGWLLASLF